DTLSLATRDPGDASSAAVMLTVMPPASSALADPVTATPSASAERALISCFDLGTTTSSDSTVPVSTSTLTSSVEGAGSGTHEAANTVANEAATAPSTQTLARRPNDVSRRLAPRRASTTV